MRKKKLQEIHGKEEKFKPTTLDQVWGDTGLSKYRTLDLNTYAKSLAEMNFSDLQSHAVKIGIIPTDNRDLLTRKLVKEFQLFVGSYRLPKTSTKNQKEPSKNALKILSEGR